jgi:hypothetical protein
LRAKKRIKQRNPTALEVLRAPVVQSHKEYQGEEFVIPSEITIEHYFDVGQELRDLFPYVWNPNDAFNAFVGYASNQRKKMLDKKDKRGPKFACAYLRTLINLEELLTTGSFDLEVKDIQVRNYLLNIRAGNYKPGECIDMAEGYIRRCEVLRDNSTQVADLDKVHEFLMKVRKQYWEL